MQFNVSGVIRYVSEVTTIAASSGNINKREVLVETVEQYPESILMELTGEDATNFPGTVGQSATFSLHFRSRQTPTGRFFTSIRCWRYQINY